jgi:hypothetical protein
VRYLLIVMLVLSIAAPSSARADELSDHPKVSRCARHHPWIRVSSRQALVWCIAHAYDSPGSPETAIAVGHRESRSDLRDAAIANGVGYTHVCGRSS